MSEAAQGPNPYQKLVNTAFAEAMPLSCQIELT